MSSEINPNAIAVIGMAGRFPGADSVPALWRRLLAVEEGIRRLGDEPVPQGPGAEGHIVPAKGVLEDADRFDAAFFGFSAREADVLDPQHRVFLQEAWHALEDAGIDPAAGGGRIGCFAGASMNSYLLTNLTTRPDVVDLVGPYQVLLSSDKDFLATRTSHRLGLTGPSLTVQTACSTSLTAVHLATQSLLAGECDIALAGGVSISSPLEEGYRFVPGGILSADGHCRPFDAAAGGTVPGNGVGVVVLKRLADALDDGDRVDAVVLGTAVNNDGNDKVGYTAPSVNGQAEVIAEAIAVAQVDPASIGYVETHGTGTALGDPIEVTALNQALGGGRDASSATCALGALKSNIGHLDAAAGIASFIKAVLVVREGRVPGIAHFTEPHPALELERTPFTVSGETRPWVGPRGPRRAGVSAFGIGGTNVHVVLEEPPAAPTVAAPEAPSLLLLSGDAPDAVTRYGERLAGALTGEAPLERVSATLAGRRARPHRAAVVATDADSAVRRLASVPPAPAKARTDAGAVFLFPGQGAQYPGMGRDLHRTDRVFAETVDRCADLLTGVLGLDLRDLLLAGRSDEEAAAMLAQTRITQPALFTVEYALAKAWLARGVRPIGMIGHSVGELVAATLAGVFDPDAAVALVAERGRLVQAMPTGSMLAVRAAAAVVGQELPPALCVAAINAPDLCVVSGPADEIDAYARRAERRGWTTSALRTSHAFHSASMDAAAAAFARRVAQEALAAPELPYCSNLTGDWATPEQAMDPEYWGRHLRGTVRFEDCLTRVLADERAVLVELGPGDTLRSFASGHAALGAGRVLCGTLPHPKNPVRDDVTFLEGVGRAWAAGVPVEVAAPVGPPLSLPGYPFEAGRHWIEPGAATPSHEEPAAERPVEDRVAAPTWQRVVLGGAAAPATFDVEGDSPLARRLRGALPTDTDAAAPSTVVMIASRGEGPQDAASAVEALVTRVRQLAGRAAETSPIRIELITAGAHDVVGDEVIDPVATALACAAAVVGQEFDHLTCRALDLADDDPASGTLAALAGVLAHPQVPGPLAIRGTHAWRQDFETVPAGPARPLVRPDGAYLVTGGFGGVGLSAARELVDAGAPVVGLLGRRVPPAGSAWSELRGDPHWGRTAEELVLLSERATIVPLAADVTDAEAVRRAVEVLSAHAPLRGVIHAAGVPSAGVMLTRTDEAAASVLAPKTLGTHAVADAVGTDLDFFWVTSSVTALVGGPGQADYAAANGYQLGWAAAARRAGLPATAIAWDTWRGLGMARGLASALTGGEPVAHPLLQSRTTDGDGASIFEAELTTDDHWMLAEHRLQGHGLMPGTAYLEMVRAALHLDRPGEPFELGDVLFLQPVIVPDGCSVTLQLRLVEDAGGGTFVVRSRHEGRWAEHATGRFSPAPTPVDALRRPAGWSAEWPEELVDQDEIARRLRLDAVEAGTLLTFAFGERWRCLERIRLDGDWLEIDLALPEPYATETGTFALHPALLDVAGAAARVRATDVYYLPLTYRSLRYLAPLTGALRCRVRIAEGEDRGETMSCDMDILSSENELLVQFRGFSIKRINDVTALVGQVDGLVAAARSRDDGLRSDAGASPLGRLAHGMPAAEASSVLRRLLHEGRLPDVVAATSLEVGTLRDLGRSITPAAVRAQVESLATEPSGERHPRPDLDTGFVAPRDEEECVIAEIWQAALGVEPVGVHDDFFALGGHSLAAVQIGARMRAELTVDLDLKDFFEDPTVAGVADAVRERRDSPVAGAAAFSVQRWAESADDVEDLTDDEVEAQLRALLEEGARADG